jgi:virginiamycin B lyase
MTSHNNGARLRAGLAAVAAATALLATAWGAAPADAAPAPHSGADAGGDLYWSNTTASGNSMIGRARLDGTDVNQNFITGGSVPGVVLVFGGYLYWTNIAPFQNGAAGTIGRARLNGTDVNQDFIQTAQPDGPDDVVADSGHIYWANDFNIGRANLDGTDVNQNFIAVPDGPSGVSALAVNARYIYWTDETAGTIGRARLDGTEVNQQFITVPDADILLGVAVDPGPHD